MSDLILQYQVIVTKMSWYRHKKKKPYRPQDGIEDLEMNPHSDNYLILS